METKVFKGTVSGEIADGKYGENGFDMIRYFMYRN